PPLLYFSLPPLPLSPPPLSFSLLLSLSLPPLSPSLSPSLLSLSPPLSFSPSPPLPLPPPPLSFSLLLSLSLPLSLPFFLSLFVSLKFKRSFIGMTIMFYCTVYTMYIRRDISPPNVPAILSHTPCVTLPHLRSLSPALIW